ncbi:MAG: hypothetical protein AAF958_06230 [Planctomycetota bacterium]
MWPSRTGPGGQIRKSPDLVCECSGNYPVENIAHTGSLGRIDDTGFHWGLGSGLAGVELALERRPTLFDR